MGKTAVVILNYVNYDDTINCIKSVLKYNTADLKFFVVDNGSPNKECVAQIDSYLKAQFQSEYVRLHDFDSTLELYPKATFIVSEFNDGYARGNNKALKYVKTDSDIEYVLILNNDILFVQDIIPCLIKRLNNLPSAAIVSPLLLKKDHKSLDFNCARFNVNMTDLIVQNLRIAFHMKWKSNDKFYIFKMHPEKVNNESVEIDLPSGSCMLALKDVFFKIGCFDPNTFLYYEENILYKKISHIGKKNYIIPNLKCIHLGAQSTNKLNKNYKQFAISSKSQMYYVWHYSGANLLMKYLFTLSFALSHISRFLSSGIKSALLKK